MTFFQFLDNKFRNLQLDLQMEFSLKKDGVSKASHQWVLTIRKFYTVLAFITLPIQYLLQRIDLITKDVVYTERYADIKAYTDKALKDAREAQRQAAPVPSNGAGNEVQSS